MLTLEKRVRSQINHLYSHLKKPEKSRTNKPKGNKKIRAEINETENREITKNEWNKTDKAVARLKQRENTSHPQPE